MIKDSDIEAMFENWFKTYPKAEFPSLCKDSFAAAIKLLLPIIEMQGKVIDFYAHVNNPDDLGSWDMRKPFVFDIIQADDCNQAHYENQKYQFGGLRARVCKSEVEKMIKKMGGEG